MHIVYYRLIFCFKCFYFFTPCFYCVTVIKNKFDKIEIRCINIILISGKFKRYVCLHTFLNLKSVLNVIQNIRKIELFAGIQTTIRKFGFMYQITCQIQNSYYICYA